MLVARAGVEPATFHFSGERCYQLSYLAVLGDTSVEQVTDVWTTDVITQRPRRDSNPRPPP